MGLTSLWDNAARRGPARWTLAVLAALAAEATPAVEGPVTLKGRVVDAVTDNAIPGAEIKAGDANARSDARGYFELVLARGDWSLEVTASDYNGYAGRVDTSVESLPVLEVRLQPKVRFHEGVEVTAPSPPDGPATISVRPGQVLSVAGSLDNIFRVLQTLPGVVGTDEFSSRLSVRGGSPDENLTIMDGVEIHNPYRLFGLTSAFNPETVGHFEFSAGGFGVAHGDRLSSLLVVENRDGTRERRFGGSSSASLTDANVIFEGKLPGQAKGSWLLTARRTYYDLVADRIIHADLPGFRDFQLKSAWEPRPGQRLTVFGMRSREDANASFDGDKPGEKGAVLDNVKNDLVSASFQAQIGKGASKTIAAWYRETSFLDASGQFRSDSRRSNTPSPDLDMPLTRFALSWSNPIQDFSGREELSLRVSPRQALATGFEIHRLSSSLNYVVSRNETFAASNETSLRGGSGLTPPPDGYSAYTRTGAWLEDTVEAGERVTLVPGLRVDWSGLTRTSSVSPRLNATVRLSPSTRLKAAYGVYTQSPGYEKLAQSDYLVDQLHVDFERARHLIVGLERDLLPSLRARVELYHKAFDHSIIGRLETPAEVQQRISRYDFPAELQGDIPSHAEVTTYPTNDGKGTSYGFDLYVARDARVRETHLTGWASYTYGVANREAYGRTYPFDYDRRHAFTFVGSYRFNPRFSVSATARAFSGFPYTPISGIRVAAVDNGTAVVPDRDVQGRLIYAIAPGGLDAINSARYPFYERLDLRGTLRPRGDKGRWLFYVEILNALNRRNVTSIGGTLDYNPASDRPKLVLSPDGDLRRFPSFGVRFQFD